MNLFYLNRYNKFIDSCRNQVTEGYVEKHHIKPKSMFPDLKNDPLNIIKLTARQHYIAHWMLHKAYGGLMSIAMTRMKSSNQFTERYWKMNSSMYKSLRIEAARVSSELQKGKPKPPLTEETKLKMSQSKQGVPLSIEHRKAIGEGIKGRTLTDETKLKISQSKVGITPNRVVTPEYLALMKRPKKKSYCEHCNLEVAPNIMIRFHGDKCKHKEPLN